MREKILILDGIATNRIMLKAKLAPTGYQIVQCDSRARLAVMLHRERPHLVIASAALPGSDIDSICADLARDGGPGAPPVIVLTTRDLPAERLRLLAAGAAEVLAITADERLLLARIRSLIRARVTADELHLRDGTSRALGFAEAGHAFAIRGKAVLLRNAAAQAREWRDALRPH